MVFNQSQLKKQNYISNRDFIREDLKSLWKPQRKVREFVERSEVYVAVACCVVSS